MCTKKRLGAATPKALEKKVSQPSYSANHPDLQHLRARFIARRHRLAPSLARVVAELAFINGGAQ